MYIKLRSLLFSIILISSVIAAAEPLPVPVALYHILEENRVGTHLSSDATIVLQRTIVLSPWFTTSDLNIIDRLADTAWHANWAGFPLGKKVSGVYSKILSTAKWGRFPFTDRQASTFANYREELFEKDGENWVRTADYQLYINLYNDHRRLQKEWDATPREDRTNEMRQNRRNAKRRLNDEGQKSFFMPRERKLRQLLNNDYAQSTLLGLRSVLEENVDNNGQPITDVTPLPSSLGTGWSVSLFHSNPKANIEIIPFGYIPLIPFNGFWVINQNDEASSAMFPETPDQLTIQAEYTVVSVRRPYFLEKQLFESRGWRWAGGAISDGRAPINVNENSPFNALVTELVILRNILIKGQWTSDFIAALRATVADGKEVRIGPILLANPQIFPVPFGSDGLLITNPQVSGLYIRWSKATPNPKDGLLWNDALPELPLR